jgi:hypothetical protein
MALQKTITLANSAQGNYIKIAFHRWDGIAREASAHFHLYADEDARDAAPSEPLCLIAKLRLTGDKFDEYLSTDALAALVAPGPDPIRDQLYEAVKVEPFSIGGGLTTLDLSDATNV